MTAFEDTALWADVKRIFEDGDKAVLFNYTGILHTKKHDFDVMKIVTIDIMRDYVNNVGDQIAISFMMPLGNYIKKLYPCRDNLEFTLTRKRVVYSNSALLDDDEEIYEERFKAVFSMEQNTNITGSEYDSIDEFTLNHLEIVTVNLQLISRQLEPLRVKTAGGVFEKVKTLDLIKGMMMGESNKIKIEGNKILDSFDIVEPNNKEERKSVMIPHNTLVTALPTYLQEVMGGVYNAGVGSYLQSFSSKITWFVYPLFNVKRFEEDVKKAIFYAVPRNKYPAVERSYRIDSDFIHIAATGAKVIRNHGESEYMASGSGHRMFDARTVMKKPVNPTEDGPVGIRKLVNHELVVKAREDNLNYAPPSHRAISANPFSQASHTNIKTGSRLDITWLNASPELLYPNMPCKYLYLNNENEVEELFGVIIAVQIYTKIDGKGVLSDMYSTVAQITVYCKTSDQIAEEPETTEPPEGDDTSGNKTVATRVNNFLAVMPF
jgi:hypothetical protein